MHGTEIAPKKEKKYSKIRNLKTVSPAIVKALIDASYSYNTNPTTDNGGDNRKKKKKKGGRRNKLSMENQLLMTLEYIREYRTYFHVSQSYGISESSCYKGIKWIEDTLIKHPDFALPGRKALLKSDMEYEVVLIDAAETPIERPKKE